MQEDYFGIILVLITFYYDSFYSENSNISVLVFVSSNKLLENLQTKIENLINSEQNNVYIICQQSQNKSNNIISMNGKFNVYITADEQVDNLEFVEKFDFIID